MRQTRAGGCDMSAVKLDNSFDERQPDAKSAPESRNRSVCLFE